MNLEPIRALLELAEKATPGPWRTDDYHAYVWGPDCQMVADTNEETGVVRMRGVGAKLPIEENLAFILAARNSVPALSQLLEAVARVEALQFNWAKADGVDDPDGGTFLQCADELKRALHPEDK